MLFAEVSDAVWLALIGIGSLFIKEMFDRAQARAAADPVVVGSGQQH